MGQNPKFLLRVLLPPPWPVLANIHSIVAYDVPGTEDVGLPTKFWFNFDPALTGSVVYFAQTCVIHPILFLC